MKQPEDLVSNVSLPKCHIAKPPNPPVLGQECYRREDVVERTQAVLSSFYFSLVFFQFDSHFGWTVKHNGFEHESRKIGLSSCSATYPAMYPCQSHTTSLCLSFLPYTMGMIIPTFYRVVYEIFNNLSWCLKLSAS